MLVEYVEDLLNVKLTDNKILTWPEIKKLMTIY